jgi:hypothetical protein
MSKEEYKGAIEVSVIFHEGQRMFAVPKQVAQQEPVAWGIIASNTGRICQVELDADEVKGHNPKHIVPLYTSPPAQRKPLTDEEITAIYNKTCEDWTNRYDRPVVFARAIEAAHGIKENT